MYFTPPLRVGCNESVYLGLFMEAYIISTWTLTLYVQQQYRQLIESQTVGRTTGRRLQDAHQAPAPQQRRGVARALLKVGHALVEGVHRLAEGGSEAAV